MWPIRIAMPVISARKVPGLIILPMGGPAAGSVVTGLLLLCGWASAAATQVVGSTTPEPPSRIEALALPAAKANELQQAMNARRYPEAERVLLDALQTDTSSPRAARLLNYVGGIYFLDHDYLHAAVAWKKAEALSPLEPAVQFSLAMAYVKLNHRDWAITQLHALQTQNGRDALYPYWLGRLHYDEHLYDEALSDYGRAVALAPGLARAYDGMGLCLFFKNQNEAAIQSYRKALALEAQQNKPSAWTHLDLADTLHFLHRDEDAEAELREALRLDPTLAQAHFELGTLLRDEGRTEQAIPELQTACRLDPNFAEPHFVLARLFRGMGRKTEAQAEVDAYHRIHDRPAGSAASAPAQQRP